MAEKFYVYLTASEPGHSINLEHIKTWDLMGAIKKDFGTNSFCRIGNISRMNYKDQEYFCTVVNKSNSMHVCQLLVFFSDEKPIFYPTDAEVGEDAGTPLVMGNLVSGTADSDRFSCLTDDSRLVVSLFRDDPHSGPYLSSFLAKDQNQDHNLILCPAGNAAGNGLNKCEELSSIIGISKLDVLKDGKEEVVICNANGLTHIISAKPHQDIIRYHHKKGIRYFTSGTFGDKPCFVYLTCWNHLQVFRSVQLPWLSSKGILERVEQNELIERYFKSKNCESTEEKRNLMQGLLYP